MSNLIAIEGLDGAGKSTQINLLRTYLEIKGIDNEYLHFPRIDCPFFGELIARFLRGEFGEVDNVDPYLVAALYAADRNDAKTMIISWLETGKLVILDRYFFSNLAFQCAKVEDSINKRNLRDWITSLEFDYYQIPRPDLSLFLHLPLELISERLKVQRLGSDRDYLHGQIDIHEDSLDLQIKVNDEYVFLTNTNEDFYLIECFENDYLLSSEEINNHIIRLLNNKGIC